MRDKVLCKRQAVPKAAGHKEAFLLFEQSYLLVLMRSFAFLAPDSVPVSVREGEKMSLDEVLGFLNGNAAWKYQKAQGFLEIGWRQKLDTILAAELLFRGTVVDFDLSSYSGGGSYANDSFAVS